MEKYRIFFFLQNKYVFSIKHVTFNIKKYLTQILVRMGWSHGWHFILVCSSDPVRLNDIWLYIYIYISVGGNKV